MSTSQILLTIAIPTYDRPEPLLRCIKALLPQLTTAIEVIICDNHSKVSAQHVLSENELSYKDYNIRIVRHSVNIGMQANLARCLEMAHGEWVWFLCDDDEPLPGAVERVHIAMRSASREAVMLSFASVHAPRNEGFSLTGCEEVMTKLDNFGGFIFLSTTVVRRESVLTNVRYFYLYAYTQLGYLAALLVSVGSTGKVCFLSDEIVCYHQPPAKERWSIVNLMLGSSFLLELPLPASLEAYRSFQKHIMTLALPPKRLLKLSLADPKMNWQQYLILEQCMTRCFLPMQHIIPIFLKVLICRCAFKFPGGIKKLLKSSNINDADGVNCESDSHRLDRV